VAKGFEVVGVEKLNVLADGAINDDCCTPLVGVVPNVVFEVLIAANGLGADWVLELDGAVGVGLRPVARP
jgi:hypothetical protein